MKKFLLFLVLCLFAITANAQVNKFQRLSSIPVEQGETDGWGGFLTGVDLDKNGKIDLFAVNHNAIDSDTANSGCMVPSIYKYEYDKSSKLWSKVWACDLNIPLQNTWPCLAVGDLDGDGKDELVWAVVNYIDTKWNPNPDKIFVFRPNTDGSLGLSDGSGGYFPNTSTKVYDDSTKAFNTRPYKLWIKDINGDGKGEIIYVDRVSASFHVVVLQVDKVPTTPSETAKWKVLYNGKYDSPNFFPTGTKYDGFLIDNMIFSMDLSANIFGVKYNSTTKKFESVKKQNADVLNTTMKTAVGPYNAVVVKDIDNDGRPEILVAEGRSKNAKGKVYLMKKDANADTIKSVHLIASFGGLISGDTARGLNGAAVGDVNKDGKADFIFGGYGLSNGQKKSNVIYRLSYKGGDVTLPESYSKEVIDTSLVVGQNGQIDLVSCADIDGDGVDEVLYTSSYPRGSDASDYPNIPIITLKCPNIGITKNVEIPRNFDMLQNYPNPFNPTTNIKFTVPVASNVTLKVFNVLGQEVATLVNNQNMQAGSYNFDFNASNLSSGAYIYKITAGLYTKSLKMMLVK